MSLRDLFFTLTGVFLILQFAGCGNSSKPENLIDEDTYIDLLVEFQLAKSYQQNFVEDTLVIDSLNQKILGEYNITKQQFTRSHEYYKRQLKDQSERISEAIDRLKLELIRKEKQNKKRGRPGR